MSDSVRLVNNTDQRLAMVYNGTPIVFRPQGQPGSVLDLPQAAADYIRGHLGDQVKEIKGGSYRSLVEQKKIETFYVANMSGNPDAPPFFEEDFRNKVSGAPEVKQIYNELREPQTFKARLGAFHGIVGPGSFRYRDAQGNLVLNDKPTQVSWPGKMVEIPPYGRVEVSKEQFETLLQRDAERPKHVRGMIIPSRKPSGFEPDDSDEWTIDKYRLWLSLVPATGDQAGGRDVMGPSEAEIRAQHKDLNALEMSLKLQQVRLDLLARCLLRAHNPKFTLPSEKDFRAAEARAAKQTKNDKA